MQIIQKKNKKIGANSLCKYFERSFSKPNNYARIAKQYVFYVLKNNFGFDELSLDLFCNSKAPAYKTACKRLLKFMEEMNIFEVFDDSQEPKNKEIDPAIALFLKNKQLRNSSKDTYAKAMKELQKFLSEKELILNRSSVILYMNQLIEAQSSPYTLNTYLSVFKQFAEFCIMEREELNLDEIKVKGLRDILLLNGYRNKIANDKYTKDALNVEERELLLNSITNLRDKALIALMCLQGLRTVETLRLKWEDILLIRGKYFLNVLGKGVMQKEKIPLTNKCYVILMAYKATVNNKSEKMFDINNTRTVRGIVAKWFKLTNLQREKLSAHSLRHTTAQVMIHEGISKAMVQRFLRHQAEISTSVYTKKQEDSDFLNFDFEQISE